MLASPKPPRRNRRGQEGQDSSVLPHGWFFRSGLATGQHVQLLFPLSDRIRLWWSRSDRIIGSLSVDRSSVVLNLGGYPWRGTLITSRPSFTCRRSCLDCVEIDAGGEMQPMPLFFWIPREHHQCRILIQRHSVEWNRQGQFNPVPFSGPRRFRHRGRRR